MAENLLFPTAGLIEYTGIVGTHFMTVPLTEWSPVSSGHPMGTCTAWDSTQKDVSDFFDEYTDLIKVFLDNTASILNATIYTYASPGAPGRPRETVTYTGKVGTGGTVIPAAQQTISFKTSDFGTFRVVILDSVVTSAFQPKKALVSPADDKEIALVNYIKDDANCIQGRDGFQVQTYRGITYTLNEKLRRSYRLD